tara:strand:- start:6305 stop:7297 length:993 start_codon:yes stop_codon:yes gene_type:complete
MSKKYKAVKFWAKIPHGIWLREATSVSIDSDDNVYIFNRGNMPLLIFDKNGDLIKSWGNEDPYGDIKVEALRIDYKLQTWAGSKFVRPHSILLDYEDNIWCVDDSGHKIYKFNQSLELLLSLGDGNPSERESGKPFNRPTDITINKANGDIFISDGYGNSRIHHYDSEGKHINSWGESGTQPGQFSLPHNLCMISEDELIVCDRENHRVQIFSTSGEFIREWHVHKATAVTSDKKGNIYIAEQGPPPVQTGVKNLGHSVSIWNKQGDLIQRIGSELPGEEADQFLWPHSISVDSKGRIFVAEVSYVEVGRTLSPPREMTSFRVWEPLPNN